MKINTNQILPIIFISVFASTVTGCGGSAAQKQNKDFFTSGSRDADQRASQRMAQDEQLTGNGEGAAGEKGVKEPVVAKADDSGSGNTQTNGAARVAGKLALYDRLGGENGISNIVADFLPRALQDPRVNWQRKDVTKEGFSIHHGESVTWNDNPDNVRRMEKHIKQFLCLATGGPAHYDGKEIKSSHADMHISNAEFDATIGDLKASLDRLKIPNTEQKELLAIVESTRTEIVTER